MGIESEIVSLKKRAIEVLGDEKTAQYWLTTPKKALGGNTPRKVARTKVGLESVNALLGRIEHGVFS